MSFLEELKNRRSIYALGRNTEVSDEKIVEVIKEAVRQSPSAFNSQTTRVLILMNDEASAFWNELVATDLEATMKEQGAPEEAIAGTKEKLASFGASKGTALFFEDQDVVKGLQEQFALYADNFPVWSEQASGITSVNAWTALSSELGLGANLQHYNPVIDASVIAKYNVPASWKLRGQLNFGSIEAPAGDKEFMNDEDRFKVIG
ncbi:nitroreductase [Streptococcus parauberis]|uniref:Nitroreductase family protein n=1 Tax=Streptococcus parauberis TaxID=1348 RepID=A0AAE4HWG6_9STRE|nr:nitroreductase family protein [Streptococcus parauberis]MDT2731604.1 nitroreductase family protein [Streptococcus parauberis]OHY29444.1 nitroreductase [Streptococcus parauberis]UWM87258.1 nitroreductase family protein [Streptococcus parauberis]UWM89231.1 nitroreductase family protein [Streptococcus parauberis]